MLVTAGFVIAAGEGMAFVSCASQFGARATGESLRRVESSPHFEDSRFRNIEETTVMREGTSMFGGIVRWIRGTDNGVPDGALPGEKFSRAPFLNSAGIGVVWFGHSTVLLNIEGHIVLTDPVFSRNPSPVGFGNRSFDFTAETDVDDLPDIDAVVISHDHYDHLDMPTIKKLNKRTKLFLVPLGVAAHLVRWGVDGKKIAELDWGDEHSAGGVNFIAAPARHFSGRGIRDRNTTLWCSWVIRTETRRVFFSGDSGYGAHFRKIGDEYGPFDLALVECGQYNDNWPLIHMKPEETLSAFDDLRGKVLLPIHWGKFKLSLHSWDDPVKRIYAGKKDRKVLTPVVGSLASADFPVSPRWWENLSRAASGTPAGESGCVR